MRVLITGASRGIGAGLADAYRAAGHDVIATSRGGQTDVALDVTDPESQCVLAGFLGDSALDLLICNAGVYLDKGETLETGFAAPLWADTFAANVTGVFHTVQTLLPHLRRAKQSKVAIISSQMGSNERAKGNSLIYRASKAAATNLGSNLASALQPDGIAVGSYHPGWVRTDMGSAAADISVDQSVAGLMKRFEALKLETSGCYEAYDGTALPH